MARTQINFRMDEDMAQAVDEWCKNRGYGKRKAFEVGFFIFATMQPSQRDAYTERFRAWLDHRCPTVELT